MSSKTLRSLAKDHASGVLDKDSYRKARNLLFEGVLTGQIRVIPNEFRPPLEIQDLDATMERERTQIKNIPVQKAPPPPPASKPEQARAPETPPVSAVRPAKAGPGTPIILITGIIIVLITGLIILLLVNRTDIETGIVNTVTTTDGGTVAESEIPDIELTEAGHTTAGAELIAGFLTRNDWSDGKLQEFRQAWNSLTAEEQADGLSSPLKGQLTNAIYQQLLEERALLGLGDTATVIARQNSLVDFATGIGINDPRLKVQENR